MQPSQLYVATLVFEAAEAGNIEPALRAITDCFGVDQDAIAVLSPTAFDIPLTCKEPRAEETRIDAILEKVGTRCDRLVQPLEGRVKSLLICDMDSTLIGQECIDELADYAGVKDKVSEITERAMRGEIEFEGALRERVGLLNGLPLKVLSDCYRDRIRLNKGAKTLAATMRANGARTVIVSGGFTAFTSRVAVDAGFQTHQANILLDDGEALTGQVADPILGREAKLEALRAHCESENLSLDNALAIGDGANDLAMIQAAGLGLAYYAKPAVAAAARGAIKYTDLTTALYYQGYKKSEFKD